MSVLGEQLLCVQKPRSPTQQPFASGSGTGGALERKV